ncbi:Predicted component of the type VI protein secretion system [Pseudomonas sp. 8Z]|uniref:flagellar biosynthesis protein n=1 Tax=Pseudomonas sp. 8Z TaxID=2653166 RepID=UPI0012F1B3CF|nr:flagellar biosynthesis protein [Pseudomonas sp. 8Z]VXC13743.1 Predicted component of the type VI protein secretion system [Pseudomonas sp. 8Z]
MGMDKMLKLVTVSFLLALCVGCATSRSEVDVMPASLDKASNTASLGKKVYINTVDERVFEAKPKQADIPSLKNAEISDRAITERAIGRKRNGYGKALGDVLLPSGRTISALVGESVASAYRQAGYEVVTKPETSAAEVKVHVKEFWSWFSPGFFYVTVNNKSRLNIETDGQQSMEIVTFKSDGMQAVTDSDWKAITEAGLQEIAKETASKL